MMTEIVKKEVQAEEVVKDGKHRVLLELEEGDAAMLRAFVEYSGKAKVQVLRECLRHAYRVQFGGGQ